MAVVENRFVCDLSKPVQAQALKGNVFSLDNLGSRLSVLIYDNGQPATISGSVTANCILPDGSTVNVNGSLTTENGGSKAYVDVPQSCLLIPGILKIAIKCTSSSVITTLAAIVANVYMTKTDNVITPSQQVIADWNAEISAALAAQDAQIADLESALEVVNDGYYKPKIIAGSYYHASTGAVTEASGFSRTDYIPCENLSKIVFYVGLSNVDSILAAFYKADKTTKVSGIRFYTGVNEITVPEGAVYYGLSAISRATRTITIQQYSLNFVNDFNSIYNGLKNTDASLQSQIYEKANSIKDIESGLVIVADTEAATIAKATIASSGKIYKGSRNMLNPNEHTIYNGTYGLSGEAKQKADGDFVLPNGTTTALLYFRNYVQAAGVSNGFLYIPAGIYMLSIVDIATGNKPNNIYGLGIQYYLSSDTETIKFVEHRIDRDSDPHYYTVEFNEAVYVKPYFWISTSTTVIAKTVRMQLEPGEERHTAEKMSFAEYSGTTADIPIDTTVSTFWSNQNSVSVEYAYNLEKYIELHGGGESAAITALNARVDAHETRLDTDELALSQNSTDIESLKSGKLAKQQAVADAGKYLYIDSTGLVVPASIGTPTAAQVAAAVEDWMDEHPGITMQYDTLEGEIGVINAQYPWGDVRRYGVFPDGTTNWDGTTQYISNAVKNSSNLGLEIYWPAGYYASQCNIMKSNVTMFFEEGAEFGGLVHVVSPRSQNPQAEDQNPLRNIRLRGTVVTYGRYGQTDAQNVWIDRIHLKCDSTKDIDNHISGRGAHIYVGNDGFYCDEIISDGCDNALATLDAAISIDGFGNNPKNFHIGKIHIKDSKIHGLYLTGSGHWIGEVVVDAFGSDKLNDNDPGLQDSNGQAQSRELCGVWLNRVQDCYIGKISVNQKTTDERPNAKYSVRIDETGIASFGAIKIDQINVQNIRENNRGITFGDVNYAAPRCYADVGQILASADSSVAVSGYGLVTFAAESAVNLHSLFTKGKGSRNAVVNNSTVSQVDMTVDVN